MGGSVISLRTSELDCYGKLSQTWGTAGLKLLAMLMRFVFHLLG
jgi:hypothetical protein